jgi:hypothetical protein
MGHAVVRWGMPWCDGVESIPHLEPILNNGRNESGIGSVFSLYQERAFKTQNDGFLNSDYQ